MSLVAAPWGELIPEAIAYVTSGFPITIFSLVYLPIATYSHELAIITTLYLIPLSIALLYILYKSLTRLSMHVTEQPSKLGNL